MYFPIHCRVGFTVTECMNVISLIRMNEYMYICSVVHEIFGSCREFLISSNDFLNCVDQIPFRNLL